MIINGMQFNCELSEVIQELRAQLLANGIQLFSKTFDSGDDIMCQCPYHKGGQERKPSAGIRMYKLQGSGYRTFLHCCLGVFARVCNEHVVLYRSRLNPSSYV